MRSYLYFVGVFVLLSCNKTPSVSPIKALPEVATSVVQEITSVTAKCGGVVSSDGGSSVTKRGVCWSKLPSPTISDAHTDDGAGGGEFNSQITGLEPSSAYFIRAYATNANGTSYGLTFSFNTLPGTVPVVSTELVTQVTYISAHSGGTIIDIGSSPILSRGVCWSTSSNPSISDSKTVDGNGSGPYTSIANSLLQETTYYLRAYATNAFGTGYGESRSFTTAPDGSKLLKGDISAWGLTEEVTDLAMVALSSDIGTSTGSRVVTVSDSRFTCAAVNLIFSPDNNPSVPSLIHGFITVDFGTGCTGPNGRTRKGKIKVEFQGARFVPGSNIWVTTEAYYVDDLAVSCNYIINAAVGSNESIPKFNTNEETSVVFLNGSTLFRNSNHYRIWYRESNPLNDTWSIEGSSTGQTRQAKDYVKTITTPLTFSRSCAISNALVMPISGKYEIVEFHKFTVDFGNGVCDPSIRLSIFDASRDLIITANGD